MGMRISAVDETEAPPCRMQLTLTCDEPSHTGGPVTAVFGGALDQFVDDWYSAARRAGWAIRVGDDARTLCQFCYADMERKRAEVRRRWQLRGDGPKPPQQLSFFE